MRRFGRQLFHFRRVVSRYLAQSDANHQEDQQQQEAVTILPPDFPGDCGGG
jgi:hypothetical protein